MSQPTETMPSVPTQPPPDAMSQLRQWLGLLILLGGFVSAGMMLGDIRAKVSTNEERSRDIGANFVGHVRDSQTAFDNVADALRLIESRVSRMEGREEGRAESR